MKTVTVSLTALVALTVASFVACSHAPILHVSADQPVISVEERLVIPPVTSRRSGRSMNPGIDIFADGRCAIRKFNGSELEKRLSPANVRGLLEFFENEGLFSVSNASIERAIDRALTPATEKSSDGNLRVPIRLRAKISDCTETFISARNGAGSVQISRYALCFEVTEYPTVAELRTVQKCVDRVYDIVGRIW